MASDPLWINAGRDVTVGTATVTSGDDTLTVTDHGLVDGQLVTVDALTGGADAPLVVDAVYYVVGVDGDTFQLATFLHGDPVEFGSDGGADVHHWRPAYDAAELRRAQGMWLTKSHPDRFGARSGVHPSDDPAVSLDGTEWTVADLTACVTTGVTTQTGPYIVQHPAESGTVDPADGSLDRVDALDLQVQDDDEDTSGARRARIVYTAGTPDASPEAPDVADQSLRLATIFVAAGGSPQPEVQDLGDLTVAAGGIVPVRAAPGDETDWPTNPHRGQNVHSLSDDEGGLHHWDGDDWRPSGVPMITTFESSGTWNKPAGLKAVRVRVQAGGGGGGGARSAAGDETSNSASGGGGGYAESVILARDLGSSETVTVGSGGNGPSGINSGGDGGDSSFGAHVAAGGGGGGTAMGSGDSLNAVVGGFGGEGTAGDLQIAGSDGGNAVRFGQDIFPLGTGGGAHLGGGARKSTGGSGGRSPSSGFGGGGSGASALFEATRSGGDGAAGIVIVEEIH